ncbi:hypothetical protein HY68_27335 [Streptomyces sp. AcH 505]|nr:hypothetical protein HY68_27335 [Streptomyces sp. AcH 505]
MRYGDDTTLVLFTVMLLRGLSQLDADAGKGLACLFLVDCGSAERLLCGLPFVCAPFYPCTAEEGSACVYAQ